LTRKKNTLILVPSTARKGVFCGLADLKGGLKNPIGREVLAMEIYEAFSLMIQAGILFVALLMYIDYKNRR
jgi:hypothetical protein